jgi:hypothetical protein
MNYGNAGRAWEIRRNPAIRQSLVSISFRFDRRFGGSSTKERTVAASLNNIPQHTFSISQFILQSVVIHLAELCVRLHWLGERHSVEPLCKY